MTETERSWLAGWLEGEGWFGTWGKRRMSQVGGQCTDRDVIERVARLMGTTVRGPYLRAKENWSPIYRTTASGVNALAIMLELFPYMCARRQVAINKALTLWEHSNSRSPHD